MTFSNIFGSNFESIFGDIFGSVFGDEKDTGPLVMKDSLKMADNLKMI